MTCLGFVGLGRMGAAMAPRLLGDGRDLVVWNRSADRAAPVVAAGATLAATPADVARSAGVVFSMIRDDDAAAEVYEGRHGFLSAPLEGRLFVEMSTLRPATIARLDAALRGRGAALVDAPVSGTVGPARDGRLLALVGARPADLARARPFLDRLCRRIVHAGPVGHGALLKLVVNLPLGVYWQALAEALALGRAGGLEYTAMLDALQDSSAALAVLGLKRPAILGDTQAPAFDLASMQKDLLYILETGSASGVPMPATAAALGTYAAASANGLGAEDSVAIVRFLAEKMTRQA
ncbi:MAG: NAD(P)-dependent oxidoreductase [Steroidobacteraceae bacterium]|jgi:3-hydroxyisobutyrate dehydrogenase-like beta-hydroxyacid dehydrogenase|nr:NAD(P)-dependent oxidoreductase [Steroidobacteraceae bacterium]